jgi:hypothetical protein
MGTYAWWTDPQHPAVVKAKAQMRERQRRQRGFKKGTAAVPVTVEPAPESMADEAVSSLRAVASNPLAPAAARAGAARTLAEVAGLIGRNSRTDNGPKATAEMSIGELDAAIAATEALIALQPLDIPEELDPDKPPL